MSLQAAVERLTNPETVSYDGESYIVDIRADDLSLVLSRLAALEREVKAWREKFGHMRWTPEIEAARAATDAAGEKGRLPEGTQETNAPGVGSRPDGTSRLRAPGNDRTDTLQSAGAPQRIRFDTLMEAARIADYWTSDQGALADEFRNMAATDAAARGTNPPD